MTTVVVAVALLIISALAAPAAAAQTVTLQCTTTLGMPHVIECSGESPVAEGSLRCESPGVITSFGGVFTAAPASCTATGSTALVSGEGELTADFLTIDTTTGTVSILNGTAGFSLTQPQTGSSLAITCDGSVLVLTVNPFTLNTPLGTCEGDLTVNLPGGGTAQAGMVCSGSAVALTTTPLALVIGAGSCEGELTVTVPGVGTVHITGDNPSIAFTTDPVPVLTITGPNLTVEVTLVGGVTETVQCSSAVIVDFSLSPLLTIPQNFCTTT
jgi:hypothetical protein